MSQTKPKAKRAPKRKPAETKPATILMLRTCQPDGASHNGFRWPLTVGAEVACNDWKSTKACGNGLHGLPWGVGDGTLLSWDPDAVWLVWEAVASEVVDIDGAKSRAPRGVVRFVGAREEAARFVLDNGGAGKACVGAAVSAGDRGTASAGDRGTILQRWWDGSRYRIAVGYVGEAGIEPNKKYRCDERGNLVPAEP